MIQKIIVAADHGAYDLKLKVVEILTNIANSNYIILDVGCYSKDSVDYPDLIDNFAKNFTTEDLGIVMCTSGIGVSICANKIRGTRVGLCRSKEEILASKKHNNINILAMGAKYVNMSELSDMLYIFLHEKCYEERHLRRIVKIKKYFE